MIIKELQTALNARGVQPPLAPDGVAGKKTLAAVDALLATVPKINYTNWPDARRLIAVEQIIYRDIGIEVGTIDGLVGEQTRYARTVWEARKIGDKSVETWRDAEDAKPPIKPPPAAANVWPRENEAELQEFYGSPGEHFVMLDLPYTMRIAWEPDKTISRFSCHEKIKPALGRVFAGLLKHYGSIQEIMRLRLDLFGGCANVRRKRGGTSWSMHARAAAVDIDPDRNQLKFTRDQATLDDPEYDKLWEVVEGEGLSSLGRLKNFDWMHFQGARP